MELRYYFCIGTCLTMANFLCIWRHFNKIKMLYSSILRVFFLVENWIKFILEGEGAVLLKSIGKNIETKLKSLTLNLFLTKSIMFVIPTNHIYNSKINNCRNLKLVQNIYVSILWFIFQNILALCVTCIDF